mgnify:CR=1 FL=1
MDTKISCPLFNERGRLCMDVLPFVPQGFQTLQFCLTSQYAQCPFFKYVNNPTIYCEYFKNCSICERFVKTEFEAFVELAETWCLSHFRQCARREKRNRGEIPPPNLLPSGDALSE